MDNGVHRFLLSVNLVLLLVCCLPHLTTARHAQKCCPPNEVLLWCPPVCEPTCDNDCVPTPTGIPMETCVCKPGFVRHHGRCIERCECPAPSPPTEPPTECPPTATTPKPCARTFHGMTRNGEVPPVRTHYPHPYSAHTQPGPYSMMSQSQNLSSCSNYLYRPPVRPCPPKPMRTTTVSPFAVCPPNEVQQPSPICCEETCTTNCAAVLCPAQPPTGPLVCTCDSGFVRHKGRCIPRNECPVEEPVKFCGPNAHYSPCTPCCQQTCDNDCSKIFCIAACTGPPTCVCNEGYVLHEGRCILPSECPRKCPPTTVAPPHRYYYTERPCTPVCPPGASLRPYKPCCVDTCTTDCRLVRCTQSFTGPPTCVCDYGLVMHNNRCIPRDHCPTTNEPMYCGFGGSSHSNPYSFLMDE
ncbi:zonadhesin-like [Anopheles stephensi]|uniref:zonadhesin-like n=1 Tax=Anopheles stephensi TaxID=30069 RepID=UPI0016587B13|nr:zonadhesin-like [Anopheles stephensi]